MRSSTIPKRNTRRGVAMMLVLIAVVITTVLCGAALASRENSPAIGTNAANAIKAEWCAHSGANFVTGAIEQHTEQLTQSIRAVEADATLVSDMSIAGGKVKIMATRPDGAALQGDERTIRLRATGVVDGIDVDVEQIITLPPSEDAIEALDLSHNEFALFSTDKIDIDDGAMLANWSLSPDYAMQTPLKMGAGFSSPSALAVYPSSTLAAVALYTDTNSSSSVNSVGQSAGMASTNTIPVAVPAVAEQLPAEFSSRDTDSGDDLSVTSNVVVTAADHTYDAVTVDSATLILDASQHSSYCFASILTKINATILIRGDVTLYVEEDFELIEDSRLLLAESAILKLYIGGQLRVDSGALLGIDENETGTGWSSLAKYIFPARTKIVALSREPTEISVEDGALIVGCIYAPTTTVEIRSAGAVIGRITAADLNIRAGGRLLYDPSLDSFMGLTALDGPLYNEDGTPIEGLEEALDASLDATTVDDMTNLAVTTLANVLNKSPIVTAPAKTVEPAHSVSSGGSTGAQSLQSFGGDDDDDDDDDD